MRITDALCVTWGLSSHKGHTVTPLTNLTRSGFNHSLTVHTEKCLVGLTIRWLIQLHYLLAIKQLHI